ncbi:MAG TPA: formate--tetrahydrofolate ligase [Candidatus Krumholzibacteria bacterium]|nr:formate--tetrahydrofolate ligase [Candidatus Krumholzibacteria bacterium]
MEPTKSSLEIARDVPLVHMRTYMAQLNLTDDDFDFYGKFTGKIRLDWLDKQTDRPNGKLILVAAMTPTSKGEGKTLTTVGIGQAIGKLGKRGMIALREPSLGPVFGMKGGATGGGYAQVLPMEDINLHFNGDIHAITAAHNLLAAMLDNHIYQGNEKRIDVTKVLWPRALDMNDRALRHIVVGLGGSTHGVPRESGFIITAASEVMAIVALANNREDLKRRLGDIVVAYNVDGEVVTARDIGADRAMAVVLKDAIQPNLVQTIEHTPALVHAGPFANIAHGTSSVVATRTALKLADYVVTECGFGSDLGGEKFFDIVCRQSGLCPNALVIVATTRAIKHHGGVAEKPADLLERENMKAFEAGLANLGAHVRGMKKFGVPIVVALNRYPFDTEKEITALRGYCESLGVPFAPHEAFARGGNGATELAEIVTKLADGNARPMPAFLYDLEASLYDKVRTVATEIYGAKDVYFEREARLKIDRFVKLGYGKLPVCIAKTQSSLTDNAKVFGAPKNFTLTVTDVRLSAGAGFMVIVCGDMMLMPGLPAVPAAAKMDIDHDGNVSGLF